MIDDFLRQHGWSDAQVNPLAAAGASLRSYKRVQSKTGRSAILTIASDPALEITKFSQIAKILRLHGLSAPEIYASSLEHGLLLQEDFGDESYATLIEQGAPAQPLALKAIDALKAVQAIPLSALTDVPHYDFNLWYSVNTKSFAENLTNFYEHYLPCIGAAPLSADEIATYRQLWATAYVRVATTPAVLLLRDYKFANQMHLPLRSGVQAVGLIDFQDAGISTPYYDLIETCEPWQSEPNPALRQAVLTHYLHGQNNLSVEQLELGIQVITALRWVAWLSNCARYARQGRPHYLSFIPRIWRAVERNLVASELAELRRWLDTYAPVHLRAPTKVAA